MNNVVLSLILGLIAGAAGGIAAHAILGSGDTEAPAAGGAVDLSALDERLARIESQLATFENPPLTLEGTAGAGGSNANAVADAVVKRLSAQMDESVKASVLEAWQDLGAPASEASIIETPRRARKKRVSLSDAAAALELSSNEEADLRQIYEDTIEQALDLIAGEDGDKDEIRRDMQAAKDDPTKQMGMIGKYMPKFLPKIGELMGLQAERERKINEALGEERANRLKSEFDVEEADPFGFSGGMRFEARAGR